MIRRIWDALRSLVRRPDPAPEDLPGLLEVEADRQRAKDKWLADEARQTRQSAGTGGGI
jgi:hypothetical protein